MNIEMYNKIVKKRNNEGSSITPLTMFAEAWSFQEETIENQQKKIDELQKKYDALYRAFTVTDDARKEWLDCYIRMIQNKHELQRKIDHALDYANRNRNVSPLGNIALIDILKGESNE